MTIKEIAFTCYPVTSLKRAQQFYEGILGLKSTSTWVKDDTSGFIEYDLVNATLAIGAGAPNFSPGKSGGVVALEVDNFDETVELLKKKKVTFVTEPSATPVCHMSLVCDPDGNQIMIHQRKK